MRRISYLLPTIAVFFVASVLASMASAKSSHAAKGDPCTAPNVRNDVRPGAGAPPTKVSVGVRMIDLTEINDVRQMLTGDFLVRLTWIDPQLEHLSGCEIPLDQIWSPGMRFVNSGRMFPDRPKEVGIGPGGSVQYIQRYYGSLATYHDLRDFPFDEQVFRISLVAVEYGEDEVQLVVDEKITGRHERVNIRDWKINWVKGKIDRQYAEAIGKFYSRYDFEISAQRMTGYYVWKVILPLCLIVAMSWAVFWISPAKFGPQIGLSATSMLTLIAFLFATINMLPKLNYLTILDYFIIGSLILVFLALVQSLTTVCLFSMEKEEIGFRIVRVCRWAFPLLFAALLAVVFFH